MIYLLLTGLISRQGNYNYIYCFNYSLGFDFGSLVICDIILMFRTVEFKLEDLISV